MNEAICVSPRPACTQEPPFPRTASLLEYKLQDKLAGILTMAAARPKLILDLGMHHGDDTVAYLRQGFRVVAIEAKTRMPTDAPSR